jgi:DNA-binding beta-propeller fold protein YncE
VLKKEVLGGDGGWDYLTIDPATRRLFISRETRVLVLDMDTCKVLKEIPNTNGVHGVALVPECNRAFTSNGKDNTVSILDLKTLEKVGEAKAGPKPDAIVYDPVSKRVFTSNNGGTTATAIEPATGQVLGNVELGGSPEFQVSDGKGRMYVNLEDSSAVVAVDTRSLRVVGRWPLAPGEEPTGLALDVAHGRLFSGCANKLLVVTDARSGAVVATLPIGGRVDGVAFDPALGLAFSSNGEGTLTVVREESPAKFSVVGDVTTAPGARTLALDPRTHRIYLATARFGPTPAPTAEQPRPRPSMVPGTFEVMVFGE